MFLSVNVTNTDKTAECVYEFEIAFVLEENVSSNRKDFQLKQRQLNSSKALYTYYTGLRTQCTKVCKGNH